MCINAWFKLVHWLICAKDYKIFCIWAIEYKKGLRKLWIYSTYFILDWGNHFNGLSGLKSAHYKSSEDEASIQAFPASLRARIFSAYDRLPRFCCLLFRVVIKGRMFHLLSTMEEKANIAWWWAGMMWGYRISCVSLPVNMFGNIAPCCFSPRPSIRLPAVLNHIHRVNAPSIYWSLRRLDSSAFRFNMSLEVPLWCSIQL